MKLISSALVSLIALSMIAVAHPDYAASTSERRMALNHVMQFQTLVSRASSNGATCKEDTDCTSGNCKASTTFIIGRFRDSKCTAKVGNGSSCDADKDCTSSYCSSSGFFSGKKCAANPTATGSVALNGKCNRNADCASQLCDLNKCKVKETGESCTVDANCPSGNVCIGATENRLRCYATNLANGAYCLQDKQCKSGYCNNQCSTRAVAVGTTVPGTAAASATGTGSAAASGTGTGTGSAAASGTGTGSAAASGSVTVSATGTDDAVASQTSSSSTSSAAAATGTSGSSNKEHGHQHQHQQQQSQSASKAAASSEQPKQATVQAQQTTSSSSQQATSTGTSSSSSSDDDSVWHNTDLPGHGQEVFKCVRVW